MRIIFYYLLNEILTVLCTIVIPTSASEILGQAILAPYLGKISTESEIYGEMQQREDENQQVRIALSRFPTPL